ncbi:MULTISPECIES: hypothetical protein [Rhodobacterales]|jgi:hypothetical protein|uniref:hypothetical protein n=1 Tax=Rhodobacterales TaxID=204455 RepID=UPI00237F4587|nr:hypothetical protein [Phaeobacter gallaeciensis]MDE4097745.1 hypothetical protein [Phaeobacter gallaeciensis]MDE4106417.1 hypothetical protein [Phaeobacter gallaeciensis]MDE4111009.1 hypothetical protein [Phaeobacter gallaeciensis]MDE4115342.1 hypothetical protein [Phaeobacter gallaeciensis]MDE4119812.1 hypothetical protein [Phaeobacter gallaeciensis]
MFSPRSLTALAALILFTAPGPLAAQGASAALNEAKSRAACGAGVPVSAQYLPGGLLKVTCRASNSQAVSETLPEAMQGTGLSPTAAAGVILSSVILLVVTGDDETGTTTTTTTTTTGE